MIGAQSMDHQKGQDEQLKPRYGLGRDKPQKEEGSFEVLMGALLHLILWTRGHQALALHSTQATAASFPHLDRCASASFSLVVKQSSTCSVALRT